MEQWFDTDRGSLATQQATQSKVTPVITPMRPMSVANLLWHDAFWVSDMRRRSTYSKKCIETINVVERYDTYMPPHVG